jgi:hypothetical protein
VEEGVDLRAQTLADWSRHAHQFAGEFVEGLASAVAQACPRTQGPPPLGGAVKASGEGAPPEGRRLNLQGHSLQVAGGRGTSGGTFGLAVPQVPAHTATDKRGQRDLVSQTTTRLFIDPDVRWQGQPTPREPHDHTVLAKGADQAREGHRRDVADHHPQPQTQPAMRRHEGSTGHRWAPLAVTPDAMRQGSLVIPGVVFSLENNRL